MGPLPLFDEPPSFDRDVLAPAPARVGIAKASSSAAAPGNTRAGSARSTRGRTTWRAASIPAGCSRTRVLAEYARTFPAVCGDFSFYQFPNEAFWRRLFSLVPEGFRFAFKVPEQITCKTFPTHARYGPQAGLENEFFFQRWTCSAKCFCARLSPTVPRSPC